MTLYVACLIATLAWGMLAFGAVYPWAYQPLLVACGILGLWGLFGEGRRRTRPRLLIGGLAVLALSIGAQLVPLPDPMLSGLSPGTRDFLLKYDVGYAAAAAAAVPPPHPLSINPEATTRALLFFVVLAVFLVGVARHLSIGGSRVVVTALLILGTLIAFEGMVQKASGTLKPYGFWEPEFVIASYGPFVNRNHFAGWMMMTAFLSLGYVTGLVEEHTQSLGSGWRNRIAWFSTRGANQIVLMLGAVLVMGLSLAFTLSRSGIVAFTVALLGGGIFVARRQSHAGRRLGVIVITALLLVGAVGLAGWSSIAERFGRAQETGMGGRVVAWQDGMRIVADFPLAGVGINAFGTAMILYQNPVLRSYWREAHNDYLQTAAEGGLLVGIPALITLAILIRQIRRRFSERSDQPSTYWIRVGAVAALTAIAIQELVEFSLQIPGNAAMFACVVAIAIHRPPRSSGDSRSRRVVRQGSHTSAMTSYRQ